MFKYFEQEKDSLEFRAAVERQIDICSSAKYHCDETQLLLNVFGNTLGILVSMEVSKMLEPGEMEIGVQLFNGVLEARSITPIDMHFVEEQIRLLQNPSLRKLE